MRHGKIGRYELLHKIAAGGMAEIFLARQWGQGGFFRDVVIKRLFPHYAEHEHALRMFQDEARLLAELSHPNIPQVYDLGYSDGYWYLAMEHVGGVSLADLMQAAAKVNKPMPLAVAIGIVSQVCVALHHAHERRDREGRPLRIVHRDVTPQNIMISLDAVVKVLDFGVAQTAARADTDAGVVRGTYAYMGPEQVRGRALDKRADVFAVGVVLYEITTGRRLFRGTDVQVMTQIVERDVPPPSRELPNYPKALEAVVMGALSRDRGKRTPSAAHVALELDQFCMRNGLVTGPLIVSHYVRSIFPYERAHEPGMGIAGLSSPGTRGMSGAASTPAPGPTSLSPEELEQRLLADELRELKRKRTPADAKGAEAGGDSTGEADEEEFETEVEELNVDELLVEESLPTSPVSGASPSPAAEPEAAASQEAADPRLGLDRFDEDSDVKPVVLLSPKRKVVKETNPDVAFVSDLERRLREDAD